MATTVPGDDEPELDLAGIFGDGAYELIPPPRRDFKPWHYPRKQAVRNGQWAEQARRMLDGRPSNGPLRYFGLPGEDLLDIRYLHRRVCEPQGRGLVFLGLNTAASGNDAELAQNAALYDVKNLAGVDPDSKVIADDFRRFADRNSVAWQRARELGPFDIVNLDLCDGFTSDAPTAADSMYRAISELAEWQFRQPNSWVLFLTTRLTRDNFHPDALQLLTAIFQANLELCPDFAEEATAVLGVDAGAIDPDACEAGEFVVLMLIAISKWVLGLARRGNSLNRVTLASALGYRVNAGAEAIDLASLAFVFEPEMGASTHPLAIAEGVDSTDAYCRLASRLARRAGKLRDVDADLATDAEYLEELLGEMESLLQYQYDIGEYRSWVSRAEIAE